MAMIDRQFLETPFYGARQMTWHLRAEGHPVNIKRVRRLMRLMGLMPIYRQPRTSVPAKGHKIYPYLLRGMAIKRPNSPVMKSLSDQSVSGATMMTSIAGLPSMFATMAIARAASN